MLTVWLTGLPAAGKTTLGDAVAAALSDDGHRTVRIDGDVLRRGLCSDLGFSAADREENVRRAAHVGAIIAASGTVVVVSLVSPYRSGRQLARRIHEERELGFIEVFVDTDLEECRRRDPRGLYRAQVSNLTGVDDPYEPPDRPDVHVHPGPQTVAESTAAVLEVATARLAR
jgi:adenylyl-sulfate kinase